MNKRELLIEARKNKGMTQTDLAQKLKISRAYLSKIENAKHDPSLHIALVLSDMFDLDARYLLSVR